LADSAAILRREALLGTVSSREWDFLVELSVLKFLVLGSQFVGSGEMTTAEQKALQSVAMQLMSGDEVGLDDQRLRVKRVGHGRFRMVQFELSGRLYEAIEQNPEKASRWGRLAREKHQVVQFRDLVAQKYVAVAVDGEVREYGR
jgi:hypothetical protein